MRKIIGFVVFFGIVSFSVSAQGFYFDIGIGVGGAWTRIDGNDASDFFGGGNVREIGVDLGIKAGFGPIANMPLYIVGAIGGVGHRFDDGSNFIQFNSYLIGPGVIFYPIPLVQLAGTIGFSFLANDTDLPGVVMFGNDGPGFAGDLSVALDFGRGLHGVLVGARYFFAVNTLEVSGVRQNTSVLTIFVRYAFRHRIF